VLICYHLESLCSWHYALALAYVYKTKTWARLIARSVLYISTQQAPTADCRVNVLVEGKPYPAATSKRSSDPSEIYTMADSRDVPSNITVDDLDKLLERDTKVKVAGVDIDGILRGKLMSKKKFLSIAKDGFGFCSVIFGWDMHDQTYFKELKISNAENGYRDIIAVPDLSSFRRIPWEDDVPFFLVSFLDPDTRGPISACPRGLLKTVVDKIEKADLGAMAGGEQASSMV